VQEVKLGESMAPKEKPRSLLKTAACPRPSIKAYTNAHWLLLLLASSSLRFESSSLKFLPG